MDPNYSEIGSRIREQREYLGLSREAFAEKILIAMLILPALFGVTGVWFATPAAEFAAICLSLIMFGRYQKKYGY